MGSCGCCARAPRRLHLVIAGDRACWRAGSRRWSRQVRAAAARARRLLARPQGQGRAGRCPTAEASGASPVEAQVAVLGEDLSGAGQARGAGAGAAPAGGAGRRTTPVALQPVPGRGAAGQVDAGPLLDARAPGRAADVGAVRHRRRRPRPARPRPGRDPDRDGRRACRSRGRTSVLRLAAGGRAARAAGAGHHARAPTCSVGASATTAVVGTAGPGGRLVDRLRALPAAALVLVDDAEILREGPSPGLQALVRQARDRGLDVVLGGGRRPTSPPASPAGCRGPPRAPGPAAVAPGAWSTPRSSATASPAVSWSTGCSPAGGGLRWRPAASRCRPGPAGRAGR